MTKEIEQILKERGDTYGDFEIESLIVNDIMSVLTQGNTGHQSESKAHHATYMIVTKLVRLWNGALYHPDSIKDIEGYSRLWGKKND